MSEECPPKNDIAAVFKKLRSYAANKICFDCGAKNPTWSSVTYGVFICIDCSAVHRSLGVHLSFVRSTQLDTNWTWLQLRAMQLGGNSNATQFFRQHGCTTTDAQQKYKSRAAQLYREKLHHAAVAAMRMHGTKLHIETTHGDPQSPSSPTQKEEPDFFAEHTTPTSDIPRNESQASISEEAYIGPRRTSTNTEEKGPNVILDDNVSVEAKPAAGVIGQRRPAPKKTTGKKSAFGAQKVATDFSEIERQAEVLEKTRITASVPATKEDTASQDAAAAAISSRFLAQESAKRDEQMKRMDPKKKEQVERLGMALGDGGRSKASHSVLADIKPIEQVDARGTSGYKVKEAEITLDDEWDIIGGSKDRDTDKTSSWARDTDKNSSWARDTDKSSNWARSTSKADDNGFVSSKNDYDDKSRRKTPSAVVDAPLNADAQKKFASAKAISSEQYFGATSAPDYETRTNLNRFEGSNAISSADFFNNGSGSRGGGGGGAGYSSTVSQLPDMTDIKDSVRQGVTKVAGKISQFSAGMSNYLSDHYGN